LEMKKVTRMPSVIILLMQYLPMSIELFFFIYEFQPSTNIEGVLAFLIKKILLITQIIWVNKHDYSDYII
jgi:hypothetical protein